MGNYRRRAVQEAKDMNTIMDQFFWLIMDEGKRKEINGITYIEEAWLFNAIEIFKEDMNMNAFFCPNCGTDMRDK